MDVLAQFGRSDSKSIHFEFDRWAWIALAEGLETAEVGQEQLLALECYNFDSSCIVDMPEQRPELVAVLLIHSSTSVAAVVATAAFEWACKLVGVAVAANIEVVQAVAGTGISQPWHSSARPAERHIH